MRHRFDEKMKGLFQSPVAFSLVLALILIGIVVGLNFLGSSEVLVSAEQFRELEKDGALERVEITPMGLRCLLSKRVRVWSEDRELLTERIWVRDSTQFEVGEIGQWKTAGISVVYTDGVKNDFGGVIGLGLVAALLGMGVWYLWVQVQKDRHGIGSPRRRLQELEEKFKEGNIGEDEYKKECEAIWVEM